MNFNLQFVHGRGLNLAVFLAALVTCPMERDRLITIRDKSDHDIAAGMTRVAGSGILNAFKPPPRMPCYGPAAVLVDEK
jgi:hypothetical protein